MTFRLFLTILLSLLIFSNSYANENCPCQNDYKDFKILHLTFHKGCKNEFDAIAKELSLNVETWFIPDLPPNFLDGCSSGNALYNIGHERAENIWNLNKDYFDTFDAIITSDTAPLFRIFFQNNWQKPLIIWICNRFDYSDVASLDCDFPDPEYYQLFNEAFLSKNVTVVAYTAFEHYYAQSKGVNTGNLTITPCAPSINLSYVSSIPVSVSKEECFFLPPYSNEIHFMNLSSFCTQIGIKNYCGRYSGPMDLKDFKGIIHLPYSWSNLAFFENISLGIPYFIPSPKFLEELTSIGNYFHPNLSSLINNKLYYLSEWYSPEHSEIIVYFDSWDDLRLKITNTDYDILREKIRIYAQDYKNVTLAKWRGVLDGVFSEKYNQAVK